MYEARTGNKKVEISFSAILSEVDRACSDVNRLLEANGLNEQQFAVQLMMREMLNNAVLHGSGGDASKTVRCNVDISDGSILIEIADEGKGFDWRGKYPPRVANLPHPAGDAGKLPTSSYGMKIIDTYADEVCFNDKGNRHALRIYARTKGGGAMSAIQREGKRAVIKPRRNIVANDVQELRQELKQLIDEGILEITVDMAGIQMLDSIGLGVLISTHNSLKKVGGTFFVINASKQMYDLFRSMRLTQHFSVTSC